MRLFLLSLVFLFCGFSEASDCGLSRLGLKLNSEEIALEGIGFVSASIVPKDQGIPLSFQVLDILQEQVLASGPDSLSEFTAISFGEKARAEQGVSEPALNALVALFPPDCVALAGFERRSLGGSEFVLLVAENAERYLVRKTW